MRRGALGTVVAVVGSPREEAGNSLVQGKRQKVRGWRKAEPASLLGRSSLRGEESAPGNTGGDGRMRRRGAPAPSQSPVFLLHGASGRPHRGTLHFQGSDHRASSAHKGGVSVGGPLWEAFWRTWRGFPKAGEQGPAVMPCHGAGGGLSSRGSAAPSSEAASSTGRQPTVLLLHTRGAPGAGEPADPCLAAAELWAPARCRFTFCPREPVRWGSLCPVGKTAHARTHAHRHTHSHPHTQRLTDPYAQAHEAWGLGKRKDPPTLGPRKVRFP